MIRLLRATLFGLCLLGSIGLTNGVAAAPRAVPSTDQVSSESVANPSPDGASSTPSSSATSSSAAPRPVIGPSAADLPADVHAVVDLLLTVRPADPGTARATEQARLGAANQAAWIWGARYGQIWRDRRIGERLAALGSAMDVFAFDVLALEDHGRRVLPPVIASGRNAFRLSDDGQQLATARTVLRILAPARLITTTPTWRDWLMVPSGEDDQKETTPPPAAPPAAVFPQGPDEEARWARALRAGFAQGVRTADAIFADRLLQLVTDFTGMIAWHRLFLEGKVSAPDLTHSDQAVRGGGQKMSIMTRHSVIADPARLNPVWSDWTALPRPVAKREKLP